MLPLSLSTTIFYGFVYFDLEKKVMSFIKGVTFSSAAPKGHRDSKGLGTSDVYNSFGNCTQPMCLKYYIYERTIF